MTLTRNEEPTRVELVLDEIKARLGSIMQDQIAMGARLDRMERKLENSLGTVSLRIAEVAGKVAVLGIDHGVLVFKFEQVRAFALDIQRRLGLHLQP
ncbi:MAG TPA: hypothetical protein VGD37_16305 [Kofleriaceae bacterium]|jgi:tetrahydromethanopterin S-methyltransferase subunit G